MAQTLKLWWKGSYSLMLWKCEKKVSSSMLGYSILDGFNDPGEDL